MSIIYQLPRGIYQQLRSGSANAIRTAVLNLAVRRPAVLIRIVIDEQYRYLSEFSTPGEVKTALRRAKISKLKLAGQAIAELLAAHKDGQITTRSLVSLSRAISLWQDASHSQKRRSVLDVLCPLSGPTSEPRAHLEVSLRRSLAKAADGDQEGAGIDLFNAARFSIGDQAAELHILAGQMLVTSSKTILATKAFKQAAGFAAEEDKEGILARGVQLFIKAGKNNDAVNLLMALAELFKQKGELGVEKARKYLLLAIPLTPSHDFKEVLLNMIRELCGEEERPEEELVYWADVHVQKERYWSAARTYRILAGMAEKTGDRRRVKYYLERALENVNKVDGPDGRFINSVFQDLARASKGEEARTYWQKAINGWLVLGGLKEAAYSMAELAHISQGITRPLLWLEAANAHNIPRARAYCFLRVAEGSYATNTKIRYYLKAAETYLLIGNNDGAMRAFLLASRQIADPTVALALLLYVRKRIRRNGGRKQMRSLDRQIRLLRKNPDLSGNICRAGLRVGDESATVVFMTDKYQRVEF